MTQEFYHIFFNYISNVEKKPNPLETNSRNLNFNLTNL